MSNENCLFEFFETTENPPIMSSTHMDFIV
jgi:hypothetical protein